MPARPGRTVAKALTRWSAVLSVSVEDADARTGRAGALASPGMPPPRMVGSSQVVALFATEAALEAQALLAVQDF